MTGSGQSGPATPKTGPTVSVVVPVLNDPAGIDRILGSLTTQTYPDSDYEVIIVDNGSSDETPAVIDSFVDEYPDLVTHLTETGRQSSYAARNIGIVAADGSTIAFVDADMRAPETYLEQVANALADGPDYVGCNVVVEIGRDTYPARYNQLFALDVQRNLEQFDFASTAALAIDCTVVEHIGCFDGRMISSGDAVFGQQVKNAGFDMEFCSDIIINHLARETVRELVERDLRIGKGIAQWELLHPRTFDGPPVYDPQPFLPPDPRHYLDRLSTALDHSSRSEPLSRVEIVVFYFLFYSQCLFRAVGRLIERLGDEKR